jgi:two-component system NtrC family sensor kinase
LSDAVRVPRLVSLRTELLVSIGIVALAALFLAVASVVVLYDVLEPSGAALYMGVLIAVEAAVFLVYAAYTLNKAVVRPLSDAAQAAEAIAAGDLDRRLPAANSVELKNLADSVNRMTDQLIADRVHLVRVEKMASIGRLAAGIAHEVGNPLGAINGYAHVLRTYAATPEGREAVGGLEREAGRIDRIVRGLLDYARPSPRISGNTDVGDVARNVVELLMSQGALKSVELRFSPASEPLQVPGDRHDLEQMFINLVLNAVDAMQNRGSLALILRKTSREELLAGARRSSDPEARAPSPPSARAVRWLDERPARDVVMIAVVDSGPGIPEEDLERVFEPFYTTKEPGKGTGLGLAIVARAVENSTGTIWVSRSREGGAAFRILMPLVSA